LTGYRRGGILKACATSGRKRAAGLVPADKPRRSLIIVEQGIGLTRNSHAAGKQEGQYGSEHGGLRPRQLSVEDRLALAQQLWDSIAEEVNRLPLTSAQQQEIDRRLAAHRANPQAAVG
jgi:putative addiction module component (TIGR02574 family)